MSDNIINISLSAKSNPVVNITVEEPGGVSGSGSTSGEIKFIATGATGPTGPQGTNGTAVISDNSVTSAKLADNSVGSQQLISGSVGHVQLSPGSVYGNRILDNSIDGTKLIDGAITSSKIANNTIGEAQITDGSITRALLSPNVVTGVEILDGSIYANQIANNNVVRELIQNNAVGTNEIEDDVTLNGTVTVTNLDLSGSSPARITGPISDPLQIKSNSTIDFQNTSGTTIASLDQNGNLTISGTVDGIDINSAVTANTAKNTNVSTNITVSQLNNNVEIQSSDGTNGSISVATPSVAGSMSKEDKLKLNTIEANAQQNVQSDWNATTGDAYIDNKPTLLQLGTSSTTALAGDTTTISTAQANAITANTAKVDLTVENAGTVHASNYTDTNTNIANTDLTFTSNRALNLDGGDLTLNSGAVIQFNTDDFVVDTTNESRIQSSISTKPLFELKNTTNDANGPTFRFIKDKGAAGANNDVSGQIEFYADDSAQQQTLFARIQGVVKDASNNAEEGKLTLSVASHDGELKPGVTVESGNTEDKVNVTLGNTTGSITTTTGELVVSRKIDIQGESGDAIRFDANSSNILDQNDEVLMTFIDGGITALAAASNLDIGSHDFKAQTFTSDVATGTAPFTVSSTTEVANLRAATASALVSGDQTISGNLAVTGTVDGIDIATDVAANTAKTSFPGFGTTAGTALEGNTVIPAAYTDANAVSAVAAADNYLKNDASDTINGTLTIGSPGVLEIEQSGGNGSKTRFRNANTTSNRTIDLPDNTGILALTNSLIDTKTAAYWSSSTSGFYITLSGSSTSENSSLSTASYTLMYVAPFDGKIKRISSFHQNAASGTSTFEIYIDGDDSDLTNDQRGSDMTTSSFTRKFTEDCPSDWTFSKGEAIAIKRTDSVARYGVTMTIVFEYDTTT
jgi:hypothetical protein